MKDVRITWSGLCSPKDVSDTGGGVYQFYGFHPVYGDNVLLYIGKADNFRNRISSHGNLDPDNVPSFFKPELIKIRLGHITSSTSEISLEDIERLLIFIHSPAWNADCIAGFPWKSKDLTIYNDGQRGSLREKVSWEDIYDN